MSRWKGATARSLSRKPRQHRSVVMALLLAAGLGSAGPALAQPSGLLVGSFVTDDVLRYNAASGLFVNVFASGNGMDGPIDIILGTDGQLYVSSTLSESILRFDATGEFVDEFVAPGSGGLDGPQGMAFGPDDNFYVGSRRTWK